jgi:hypothetical protein
MRRGRLAAAPEGTQKLARQTTSVKPEIDPLRRGRISSALCRCKILVISPLGFAGVIAKAPGKTLTCRKLPESMIFVFVLRKAGPFLSQTCKENVLFP